jgi:hypothetical protein
MTIKGRWLGMTAVVMGSVFAGTTSNASPAENRGAEVRLPFEAQASLSGRVILPNPSGPAYAPYVSQCLGGQAPVQVIQGAGDSPDLGLFTDVQTHCLGLPEADPLRPGKVVLPFFGGVFTFTNSDGRTVTGQYNGQLRETDTSTPPPSATAPPTGGWIIEGRVCISGGTLFKNIVDDCKAGRWFDARGLTILDPLTGNTNLATLFLHQTIGIAL